MLLKTSLVMVMMSFVLMTEMMIWTMKTIKPKRQNKNKAAKDGEERPC